ncbi:MAG TPA: AI-2E family transporter [Bacteriovoracaceae bacterium]|nr:AI-2E family transporter [Bacteriovoracaceae bacterium]
MSEQTINLVVKNFFKITFAMAILGIFFYVMMPFLVYILLGGILAMALTPFVDFFIRRGLSRGTSLVVFSSLLGLLGFVPVIAFFIRGSRVVTQLLRGSNFNDLSQKFTLTIYRFTDQACALYGLNKNSVRLKVSSFLEYLGTFLSGTLAEFMSELPTIFLGGLVSILAIYCFLRESDRLRQLFDRYFYFSKTNGDSFIRMLKVCCREVFFSNIITGLLQASIVTLGALVFNAGDLFLVFFITFVVSFIPVLGAAPVAVVLAVLCFLDARVGAGVGMLGIAFISGLSDNILRPFLGTLGEVEVHPFIGLLAVIGGVIMFGLPGLFIGPLVASLVFGALPFIIDEYFPPTLPGKVNRALEADGDIVLPSLTGQTGTLTVDSHP